MILGRSSPPRALGKHTYNRDLRTGHRYCSWGASHNLRLRQPGIAFSLRKHHGASSRAAAIREAMRELPYRPTHASKFWDEPDKVNIYHAPCSLLLGRWDYIFSLLRWSSGSLYGAAWSFRESARTLWRSAMRSVPAEGLPGDREKFHRGGKAYAWDLKVESIYFYQHDGRNIWGLTNGIVNDFIGENKARWIPWNNGELQFDWVYISKSIIVQFRIKILF